MVRGNDRSPVAVAIVLNCDADKIPEELEDLVRAGLEGGAALSGSVQTENIGLEKMVCNIVANPNIRYLILGGPESEGHLTGEALEALIEHGVSDRKRIIGTDAPHPYLYNLSSKTIERFRNQLTLINLQFEDDPEVIRKAVWSCYQEKPVDFRGKALYDPGAFPKSPLSGKITWRVVRPWTGIVDEDEQQAKINAEQLMEDLRDRGRSKDRPKEKS
jgi:tetrahydromethanopterin S-methyltransferase subunit A